MPVVSWLLETNSARAFQPSWANPATLPPTRTGLALRIRATLRLYSCELLFVHRDAEREPLERRVNEIHTALKEAEAALPAVCVVPVRMQEAWLLFDEPALRTAAGNPNGRTELALPLAGQVEGVADPKTLLHRCLREASELKGRRRGRFNVRVATHRLAELIQDYSPLRKLAAFRRLETDVRTTLRGHGWT